MSLLLYRLGRACARHRLVVIGIWALAVAALVVSSAALGQRTSDNLSLPGTGSTAATDSTRACRSRPTGPTRSCSPPNRAASTRARTSAP